MDEVNTDSIVITENIAYNIRRLRYLSGITQKDLGSKIGVPSLTISRIETLYIRRVQKEIIDKIAKALKTDFDNLRREPKVIDVPVPRFARRYTTAIPQNSNNYCRICGTELYYNSNYCHKCGTKVLPLY